VARFKRGVGELMPMLGLSREFEPNIENIRSGKLKLFKQQIIPFPSLAMGKKNIENVKNMINSALSDEAQASYNKFLSMAKPSDRLKYEKTTTIPQEYVEAWAQNPESVIKNLAKVLAERFKYLKESIEKLSALEDASFIPLMRYAGKFVTRSYEREDIVQYLNTLGSSNEAEDIIKWSKLLKSMQVESQFHIQLRRVISEGNDYGTITFDKKKIFKIIEGYADVLKEQVAPVYKAFANLNESINAYFIENRPGAAKEAADWAVKLQEDVSTLPEIEAEGAPPSPRGVAGGTVDVGAPKGSSGQGGQNESKDKSLKENKKIKLIIKP